MDFKYSCSWTSYISIGEHTYSEGHYLEKRERERQREATFLTKLVAASIYIHVQTQKKWTWMCLKFGQRSVFKIQRGQSPTSCQVNRKQFSKEQWYNCNFCQWAPLQVLFQSSVCLRLIYFCPFCCLDTVFVMPKYIPRLVIRSQHVSYVVFAETFFKRKGYKEIKRVIHISQHVRLIGSWVNDWWKLVFSPLQGNLYDQQGHIIDTGPSP